MIEKIQELESEINEKLKSNNVVVRILGNEDKNKGSIIILKDKKIHSKKVLLDVLFFW